jgi:hypothetical protein
MKTENNILISYKNKIKDNPHPIKVEETLNFTQEYTNNIIYNNSLNDCNNNSSFINNYNNENNIKTDKPLKKASKIKRATKSKQALKNDNPHNNNNTTIYSPDPNLENLENQLNKQIQNSCDNLTKTTTSEKQTLTASDIRKIEKNIIEVSKNNDNRIQISKLPEDLICKVLTKCKGNLSLAAKMLKCDYKSFSRFFYKNKDKENFKNAFEDGKNLFLDIAENKLLQHIQSSDPRISLDATKFVLSTLGKNRGFNQKQEIEIENNINISPDIEAIKAINQNLQKSIKFDDILDVEILSDEDKAESATTQNLIEENF